jgi:hypothetical protein
MSWAPSVFDGRGTTGIFVTDGTEWHAYPAARRFLDTIRDYDGPSSRVYAWYRGTLGLTISPGRPCRRTGTRSRRSASTRLSTARTTWSSAAPAARRCIRFALSTRAADLAAVRHAVTSAGFGDVTVKRASLDDGRLHFILLRLTDDQTCRIGG